MTNVGGTKVQVIKAVRELTGLGLIDAKKLVDAVPAVIKENISPDEAEKIKEKLMEAWRYCRNQVIGSTDARILLLTHIKKRAKPFGASLFSFGRKNQGKKKTGSLRSLKK